MKTITEHSMKWLFLAILILPVFVYGQATSRSGQNAAVVLTAGKQDHKSGADENRGPSNVTEEAQWIHYDDTEMSDSWGFLIAGEEYDVVAKWDPADLSDYDGWEITKIKFIVVNDDPYLKVKVWEGPNTTEIYSQDVDSYNVNAWTEVTLDTPVDFDADQELWVGYYVDMTHTELGGFVTATDDGPPVDEYGNLYRFNGSWYSDFNNHNLRVYIEPNLNADFEADATMVCYGSTVNFTNLSSAEETYSWTFEGGTPATSTDENPSVVYDTPGTYDVTLEVTRDNGNETDTEIKYDYISVLETPAKADQPDGDTETCTSSYYTYETNEVLYATDYEWELSPADAGTLTWEDNLATLETDVTWTGDFTIKVRAANICGDGDWSDEIECTLYTSPEEFNLEGGGSYCLDDDGVEITLDGSQTGVDYELFLDGEATGIVVSGTGAEISFGLVTDEGYYSAVGSNDNCDFQMSGQVQVSIDFPPLEPATPEGPTVICEETSSDYSTEEQDDADSYVWVLTPAEAGTISGEGVDATVEWDDEFSGMAYISVYGVNYCGDGNPSNELEVSVGSPNPIIEGADMVCDFQVEDYAVEDHEGSTYTWEVTGGTITAGQGASTITVEWGVPGDGLITVSEETADGCSGDSEEFEVLIDECTSLRENDPENKLSVSPNPASGNFINVNTGNTGTTRIAIINIAGLVSSEHVVSGLSAQIEITDLPRGLYFLKATFNKTTQQVVKFIKK